MSIIHDALKKVQQGLTPKPDETPATPSGTSQKGDTYIYATPPPVAETNLTQNKNFSEAIKSIIAVICALAITVGCGWYIYQQYGHDFPVWQELTKKKFYKLINKEEVPDFKNKRPEDLKPLAQITIPPPAATNTSAPVNPATPPMTPAPAPPAPVTLNIHGIMSNATGNVALINDQVYQEGDEVDGAKIIKISLNSVTVDIDGTEKTIFVKD